MIDPTPLELMRGNTIRLRGTVRQWGDARDLTTRGDTVVLQIVNDSGVSLLSYSSGTPNVTFSGNQYFVVIPSDALNLTAFPLDSYDYRVDLTEGDTSEIYLIAHGTMTLALS